MMTTMSEAEEVSTEVSSTPQQEVMMDPVQISHVVVYRYILSVIVCLGILTNGLSVLVLTRPRLRALKVNKYFLVMAVADLLICILYIPIITTVNGCTFSSHFEGHYFAHAGWPLVCFSKSLSNYILVSLAMDRFLGVWMPWTYRKIQSWPNFMWTRLLVVVLGSSILHILYVTQGTVDESLSPQCGNGNSFTVMDAYQQNYKGCFLGNWYKKFYFFWIRWLPCLLLIIFNSGLVTAVVKGRIRLPQDRPRTSKSLTLTTRHSINRPANSRERRLVLTLIAMSSSSILLMLPITVSLLLPSYSYDCCTFHALDVVRDVGNILQLVEHVINIFFLLALNDKFNKELKSILRFNWSATITEHTGGKDTINEKEETKNLEDRENTAAGNHLDDTHSGKENGTDVKATRMSKKGFTAANLRQKCTADGGGKKMRKDGAGTAVPEGDSNSRTADSLV